MAVDIVFTAASTAAIAEAWATGEGLEVILLNSSYIILKCVADSASIAIYKFALCHKSTNPSRILP